MPATSGPAQHQAVAANIASIVARELELGPEVRSREHDLLREIGGEEISDEADLAAAVAAALRKGFADSDEEHERVRTLLTEIVAVTFRYRNLLRQLGWRMTGSDRITLRGVYRAG